LVILGAGWYFFGPKNPNMMMPKVNAKVAVVSEEVIKNSKKYVALVEAINSVDVVAKVSGSLDKVNFVEGSFVKKDDPLFVIDKEPYQANYDLAQAQMESAEATLTRAERDYNRQKQLSAKNIASKATFDAAESAYLQAKAAVSQAKARLNLAEIDLKNTEVKAYIDGQIGKTQVTVGNFVTASSMVLARVSQIDPIRIAFSVTDKEFLEIQRAKEQEDINDLTINIELSDGDVLQEKLEQAFASNETNMGTATIAIYVDVKNDKHYLNPGTYVNISFTSNKEKKGLVVPETAIIQSDNVSLVFVVGEDNVAKMRPVTLGEAFDGKQVIASGLNAGERVLISGLANRMLRDGAVINVIDDTSNTVAQ
jgi:membrane fusion protein (multidrug efflux system)